MGTDNTYGENNFNPEKITQLELTYIKKLKAFNNYLLKYSGSSIRIDNFRQEITELEKQIQFEMLCNPDFFEASANEHLAKQMQEESKCKSCKWMKIGYGHCNFCINAHYLSKYDKSCTDNFEPKTDE